MTNEQGLVSARRVLAAAQALQRSGQAPTVRAIGEVTGLASSTVWHALLRLRADYGYVRWDRGRAGTLRITERYE
jgi:SOS-response transcriptional repressor LexA